jgi:multisubunit Na+/H+ antiporter MnhB subunit
MQRPTHILNAASNLLGIALLIIAGLNVSHVADKSFADEIAWIAAMCLAASCLLSYLTLRHERGRRGFERWADRIFLIGMVTLFAAIVVLAVGNR